MDDNICPVEIQTQFSYAFVKQAKPSQAKQEAITYNLTLQYSVRWAGKVACRGRVECTAAEKIAARLGKEVRMPLQRQKGGCDPTE